jgi:hypothetical protein
MPRGKDPAGSRVLLDSRSRADPDGRPHWILLDGTVEGAVVGGGTSAMGAALGSLGIPKDSVDSTKGTPAPQRLTKAH